MPRDKLARWLDLIALLLDRGYPVTREEIFDKVAAYRATIRPDDERSHASTRRTFERDKDELRALGVTIRTREISDAEWDEARSGYSLSDRDFYLPYFELASPSSPPEKPYRGLTRIPVTSQDLDILDRATARIAQRGESPLGAAAQSARRKLTFDLPFESVAIERALAREVSDEGKSALATLQVAVASRTAVTFGYYSIARDQTAGRSVEPWGLFFSWGHWYLVGHDRDRNAERVFRVARMTGAVADKGKAGRFEPPDGFDIRWYVGRAPWELSQADPVPVTVRFDFPESRTVLARQLGTATSEVLDDGGAEVVFQVRERGPFLRWLLTMSGSATVVDPEDVAEDLENLRQRVLARYTAGGTQ